MKDFMAEILKINKKAELINKTVSFFQEKIEKEIASCEETEKNPNSFDFKKRMNEHRFRMILMLNKLGEEEKNLNELEKSTDKLRKNINNSHKE
jgi:hypothetical protein